MYVCGLTVDNVPHIGHGRFALVYDILRRYLIFRGLDVHYVSNVTDIDDKIIARAAKEGRGESDGRPGVRDTDVGGHGCPRRARARTTCPHATGYVDDMVALVSDLVGPRHRL